jgi:hypothetical protein
MHKAALVLVKNLNTGQGKTSIFYDNFSDEFVCAALRHIVYFRQIYIEKRLLSSTEYEQ